MLYVYHVLPFTCVAKKNYDLKSEMKPIAISETMRSARARSAGLVIAPKLMMGVCGL